MDRQSYIVSLVDGTRWYCTGDEEQIFDEVAKQEGFSSFAMMVHELKMHPNDFSSTRQTVEPRPEHMPAPGFTEQIAEAVKQTWQNARRQNG